MKGQLTSDVLKVLLLKRMSLSIIVGHKDKPSVNLTSRPLRQVMYELLLGEQRSVTVEERDREGLQLKFIPVKPTFSRVAQELQLSSLNEVSLSERLQVLLEALGVTEDTLSDLEPELRLPVAVTCYWLQRAQPPPDLKLLKALLLGMTNEDALRAREDLQVEHPDGKPDLDVAHAFNQWQVCLKDSIQLNQLLCFPLPEPDVARLYQGTLVHQLVNKMTTGVRLKAFLKSDRSSVKQCDAMLSIIQQFHARATPSDSQQRAAARRRPVNDLTANEEVSSGVRVQEELVDLVSVRTRYRTKERKNRSKNPELVRKEEESRGQDLL